MESIVYKNLNVIDYMYESYFIMEPLKKHIKSLKELSR